MMLENELYEVIAEDTNSVSVRLLPESAIYKAHFPGNPITPGVCQVAMVAEQVERRSGRRLQLKEAKNLKFLGLLRPDVATLVVISFESWECFDKYLTVKCLLKVGEKTYTKFTLTFE